jgi:hypothetical protein
MTKKYPIYSDTKPSEDFLSAFPGGGGAFMECTCGRTHLVVEGSYVTSEEVKQNLAAYEKDPDQYLIHYDVDCVHYVSIDGRYFVDDCPCNGPAYYEHLFWNCRREIRQYLALVKMRKMAEVEAVGDWNDDL